MEVEITIEPDGSVSCLAPDDLDLRTLGTLHVRRASRIEFDNDRQEYVCTLTSGVVLGGVPTRAPAIAAEVPYLNAKIDDGTIMEVIR